MRARGIKLGCCQEMSLLLWSKRPWRPGDVLLGYIPATAQALALALAQEQPTR